ncbi:MAG TPA: carbamoyltransferase [Patescibacteria group bacterium]|nr:carbamoyltransferase [Patescibacteria group bacterium]
MTKILGISCFYHDSAAALIRDGAIVAAAQEERFTRKKHDFNFPAHAIAYCLAEAGIKAAGLDAVVFYDKPFIKFERILETSLAYAPTGIRQFVQAIPLWLKQKLWIPELIRKELSYGGKVLFTSHHESHAASSFYPSPFAEAAFLTMDGVGEWDTASFGVGKGNELRILATLRFPHSLGLLYSAFTYYTGFKVNSGEYKLMGLAPYGNPVYTGLILDKLLDLKEDGSFKLRMEYFGYCNGLRMTNRRFEKLFGGPARRPETQITQKDMDIASSIQQVTEEIMLRMARHVHKTTGMDDLCLAGGVALNCVGNGRILREGPFKRIWIQPASGDAGGALGAALLAWHRYFGAARVTDNKNDTQQASLLGPHYPDEQIEAFLVREKIPFTRLSPGTMADTVADLIAQGNVIGWFQGRLEFGPRALGARSIIGDARSPQMQSKMNLKIKYRESFRPFAPTVLEEEAGRWFDLSCASPYMLLVAPVKGDKLLALDPVAAQTQGFDKLHLKRSQIPAVTHVDNSARIQTIRRQDNPLYYDMIKSFFKKTGCPVIINTSFNVRGEPLVCSPENAFTCFMRTEMDYLAMGSFLLDKKQQAPLKKDVSWQKVFELD